MTRGLKSLILLGSVSVTAALWAAFYLFYAQWRGCFDATGRCFDAGSGVVYSEQSGLVWGPLAVLATGVTLVLIRRR